MGLPNWINKLLGKKEPVQRQVETKNRIGAHRKTVVVNPTARSIRVDQIMAGLWQKAQHFLGFATRHAVQLACTPEPLRDLHDHKFRGKKSLTRIASLRFKERQRCGRGKKNRRWIGAKVKVAAA